MTQEALTERGVSVCRGCMHRGLVSVLDLGSQPLANELSSAPDNVDPVFPLHLRICPSCGLGQVGEFVLPERIFSDYPYLSSMSSSWLEHARSYAERMHKELRLGADDLVVEVASNDGYLLKAFQRLGQPVLGIEPAANIVDVAGAAGVPTLCAFFGRDLAGEVVGRNGHPRLVVANNVMAHVPDLDDFVGGLARLCDESTVITVENPALLNLLLETQFDTIYHEHFSYLSATAVQAVAHRHGLELVAVDRLHTHGGSYRYWLALSGALAVDESVPAAIAGELEQGLLSPIVWEAFAQASRAAITGLRSWLDARQSAGAKVVAVGASAKGNTLLNAANVTTRDIAFVTDASPEKQGRFLPGSHVPVTSHRQLARCDFDDVLVTPWNIADELAALVSEAAPDAAVWVAVPSTRRLR